MTLEELRLRRPKTKGRDAFDKLDPVFRKFYLDVERTATLAAKSKMADILGITDGEMSALTKELRDEERA